MDLRFQAHNRHRDGAEAFSRSDPHLRRLASQPLVWRSPLLDELPRTEPGIYTLGGARQIGKTTLLKQWMQLLLEKRRRPDRIAYLTGELIGDHHALVRLVQEELEAAPGSGPSYLVVDEITYVSGWQRGVKFLADAGLLDRSVLILTGSDLSVISEARTQLPGRRGRAERVDYHLHPLTFTESCGLRGVLAAEERRVLERGSTRAVKALPGDAWDRLELALERYLIHGGFLTAMNDLEDSGKLRPATLATYSDWIRGDVLRRGKGEVYLREVLGAVDRRLGSQVTWNALSRDLSIDHPATVADYVHLLEAMDALFVQPALREDRLAAAPKKARKVVPCDPFILHAIRSWLRPTAAPHEETVVPLVEDPERSGPLVEACVAAHARRHFPTYTIKAAGEVDVAIVHRDRFWPIEVKWRSQPHPKDLRQIAKYRDGVIAAPVRERREIGGVPVRPLPWVLARLGAGRWP
jgi:predicted AAA+ superfamily ATPase